MSEKASARVSEKAGERIGQPATGGGRIVQFLRWGVGLGAAALSIRLLVRELDWAAVVQALRSADYRWVSLALLAIVATFFVRAWRWQALLYRSEARLLPVMTALLVGQAVNTALPMRSGDLVRAAWIGPERGTGTSTALGSVALEKVWDLLALLACAILLLVWIPLPGWFAESTWGTAATLSVGVGTLWGLLHWQDPLFRRAAQVLERFPAGWSAALLPRLRRLALGVESIRRPEASARALFWTVLTWGLGALANWAVLAAFGIPSMSAAVFLLAALMLGGAVVPTPGRLGVFEGICVASLALFDVPGDLALAVGLALHLVVMGPPLVTAALLALVRVNRLGIGVRSEE